MADNVITIDFKFSGVHGLQTNLQKLRVDHALTSKTFCSHTLPLFKLSRRPSVQSVALHNMYGLTKGYRDLTLLTLEPANNKDNLRHNQLGSPPRTVQLLSDQLDDVRGARN